ncbi:MAG TPA: VOC family protein [Terriglobales bacterium]|jgi:methylmalonyl-CoA/ethylmalonyl-CoA epimerase|nr:VOC family protein [Terriglobales bacterium]
MLAGTQIALDKIGQIAILVKDIPRATEFYRDKLAMKYLFSAGNLAFFDCGGIRLMLDKPEKVEVGTSVIYFKVPEIHQAHEQIKSRGVEFVDKPHLIAKLPDHDLWMTFFRDSEGNLLGLMSEVRPPKP